jgi:iron complex outermembrane receptor protein
MKNRSKLLKLACPLIFSTSLISTLVYANDEEDGLESISLEDLLNVEVVSATRSESKLSESPVPISVITAKEIASSGLDNIPDILARLPEIDVIRIGASQTEVSIRGKGINFNRRLLTMIDGRTEYNDLFGATLWHAFPIAINDIERIEVIRGPASALFGANAYSGVINIITKSVKNSAGLVQYHTGSDNKEYFNVMGQYYSEKYNAKVSLTQQNMDNSSNVIFEGFNRFTSSTNFFADDTSLDGVSRANIQLMVTPSENMDFKFAYGSTNGDHELFQQPGLPRSKWDISTDYLHFITNYYAESGTSFQFNIYKNTFDYATPLVPTTAEVQALSFTDGLRYFPSVADATIYEGNVETVDMTFQVVGKAFEDKMSWVAGAEFREIESIDGLLIAGTSKKDITSYFGNFTYKFNEQWHMGAGYRVDDDSITGQDDGYTLSLSHFLNETDSLRFTARSAFRAPSLFELYSQIDLEVTGQNQNVSFVGAELLTDGSQITVETITSLDITYTANISDSMQLTAEIFHEEYENIIGNPDSGLLENVVIDGANNTFVTTTSFQNQSLTAEADGLQLSLVWIANEVLTTYANYRYEDPKNLNSVPGETFFTPENKANLGAKWTGLDNFVMDLSYNYVGKTDPEEFLTGNSSPDGPNFTRDNQHSYSTLNLSIHYTPASIDNLKLYLTAYNLLDDAHVEYYEYDQVLKGVGEEFGRTIWGGFSWTF